MQPFITFVILYYLQDAGEEDEDIARRLQEEENTSRRPSRAVAKKPVMRIILAHLSQRV